MKVAAHLLGIVYETQAPRTFAAFMERLEAIDPVELKLHLFGHYDTTSGHIPHDVVEGAARGDAAAIEQVLEALAECSDKHELYRGLLQMDGLEVKARIVDLLPRWYEHVFAPHEPEWREAAERDAEAKFNARAEPLARAVRRAGDARLPVQPAGGDSQDRLLPELVHAPLGDPLGAQGHEDLLLPDRPRPRGRRLAGRGRAGLQGARRRGRLRLLRRLSDGPLKLSEAAAELGVAKSTAHHHLAILRQAGFVTIRDEDENVYSLRTDLPQTGDLLTAYLGGSRSSATSP